MESRASANQIFCMRMKQTRFSRAAYDNQQPRNEQLPLEPLRVGRSPAEPSTFRTQFAISTAFRATETWFFSPTVAILAGLGRPNVISLPSVKTLAIVDATTTICPTKWRTRRRRARESENGGRRAM